MDYREGGNSMAPIIKHREPITIEPLGDHVITKGDIVVARVHGRLFCHLVKAVERDRVQIGNNHGRINGWTTCEHVYGLVTHISGIPRVGRGGSTQRARPGQVSATPLVRIGSDG